MIFINVTDKNIEQLLEDETEDISKYSDYCDDESFELFNYYQNNYIKFLIDGGILIYWFSY